MRKIWLIVLLAVLLPLASAAQHSGCGLTVPVHEEFDSYGIGSEAVPTCWYVTRNYDLGYAPHLDGSRHHSGTASMVLYPGTLAESHYSMIILPEIDSLTSFDGLYLRFQMLSPSTAARLEVGVCSDTNRVSRAFVPLDTLHVDQGNRWQEMVVDLSRYSGSGRRIAFRMQRALQNTTDECYIDDLSIESCGTTTPWANHVGSTTVTLNFESFGIGTVEVTYGNNVVSPAVSPLTITGLTPDSDYMFRIGCAGSEGHLLPVHTMEGAGMTVAYYENLDAVDSVMPRHWRRPTANQPQVVDGALRMIPTDGDSCMAVLPLPANATIADLHFALTLTGSGTARLIVGAVEFADEPESFIPIDTLVPTASRQLLSLESYTGNGLYPALLAIGNGTLTVDELRLARCMADGVHIYNLTESSLTLAWDTLVMSDGATMLVEYGYEGFVPGTGTRISATHQPMSLENLETDQTYDLYVWPSCGDYPSAYDKHNFRTFAHNVTPPYCTGFEETEMPQGWVAVSGASLTDASYEGSAALQLTAGGIVTLPLLGNEAPENIYLDFYGFGNGRLLIGRMETPYSPFTATDTVMGDDSWQRYSVHLSEINDQCIALQAVSNWTLDAVALRTATVNRVTATAIEQHSAQIVWELLGGDSIRIEYAAVAQQNGDFEHGTGTVIVSGNNIDLTGLNPDTYYRLHVSPYDVLDDGSCHHVSVGFSTLSAPVEIPYCQNFDGVAVSSYPVNWRRLSQYGEYPFVSSDRNRSGGRSLRMSVFGSGATIAILPDIDNCNQHPSLALWANATLQHQSAKLIVGVLADATDTASFTPIDTILFSSSDSWKHNLTHLDSIEGHLALLLRGAATGETRVYIEDLCLEPCVASNIRVTNIDSTGATVSWSTSDSLYLVCQTTGGGRTRYDTLYNSPTRIAGFDNGTTYTLTFTTICGCDTTGVAFRPGQGSAGSTSNGGRTSISLNTHSSTTTMPYCNGFESTTGSRPSSWRYNGSLVITDRNYHNGYHSIQTTGGSTLILPPISNLTNAVLSFYLYGSHELLMGSEAVTVGIMNHPDSTETFVPLDTVRLSALGTWQHVVADLGSYDGHGRYIALLPVAGSGTLFIDDLMVAPCCIGNASIDSTGTISWHTWHGVSNVAIEYGPAGFTIGTGTTDTVDCSGASNHSVTITYLASGDIYDIYLTPLCSVGRNCQRLALQVGNVTTTPYCENFDDAPLAGMPGGWLVSRTYSNTPDLATLGGNQRLHLKAAVNNRSIATLPLLSVDDIGSHQLTLSLRVANYNRARLIVGQIADASDPNTFIPRDTISLSASSVWQTVRLPLTRFSGSDRIALACNATTQSAEIWIDTIAITLGLTPQLAVLSARHIRLTNSDTGYYVEYGPAGIAQGEGSVLHVTDSVADITGLQPQQSYWFYCRHTADELTCLEPLVATMPDEESLPYCHRRDTIRSFTLPEFDIDSLATLHLYFRLRGNSSVAVGVMERQGDWSTFTAVDTVTAPAGVWRTHHVSLASYHNNGRFAALRTTGGTNAIIDGLTAAACELPVVTLNDDNSVSLLGSGAVEYGPSGFTTGSGTVVSCPATLTLADTMSYDFYTLCSAGAATCQAPQQLRTSLQADLPLCEDFSNGMPVGWTTFSDAATGGTVRVTSGQLTMQVADGQNVGVQLPILPSGTLYVSFDQSDSAALLIGSDTLTGASHKHLTIVGSARPTLRALGSGTVAIDNLTIERCLLPDSLDFSQPGNGCVMINWDSAAYSPFYIEYLHAGQPQGTGTVVRAATPPLSLNLDPDTVYDIYLRCDSAIATCHAPQQLATLAALTDIPYCTSFEDDAVGDKPTGWRVLTAGSGNYGHITAGNAYSGNRKLTVSNHSGSTYLILPQPSVDSLRRLNISFYARYHGSNGHSLTLGVMSDATDPNTFDSLTSFASLRGDYTRCFYSLVNYFGNGKFIVLRVTDDDVLDIDNVQVNTCAAHVFHIAEMGTDYVVLDWEQQGEPQITITYGPRGFDADSGLVVHPTAPPYRIDGLLPLTNYAFFVNAHCPDSTGLCDDGSGTDTLYTFTPQGGTGCIDYTDLTASYVTCSYGSYFTPIEYQGAVDYGYSSAMSRHTVHYDTAERDARTQGLLRTIPTGEQASVRLGNWTSGGNSRPEAESITYGMTVDATAADLLVLRYAAVLQDPEHAPSLQPRFRMEILNQEGSLIDSCSMADFIANESLGWATAPNDVLWKDWTTVGVDLTPYNGQTIFVRLTTHDCGEGSHFGYAYFTLRCASKQMQVEGCSYVPNNRFTVPSGFNYRWYSSADTTATISDSSSIWVASDNSIIYYCRLSFIDNPACHFTMSAFAGARFPLAIIDTALTVADCEFDLQLYNNSTISGDGVTPAGTGEPCDSYRWLLPDSSAGNSMTPSLHLTDTGIVSVTLIVGIANDQCIDTLTRNLHITYPHPAAQTTGRHLRCFGDSPDTIGVLHAASYSWSDGGDGNTVSAAGADTTFICYTVDTNGCHDTLNHYLSVKPVYDLFDPDSVCSSSHTYDWRDTTVTFVTHDTAATATLRRHSQYGCDSVMTLALHLWPDYYPEYDDTICDGSILPFFDTTLTTPVVYTHHGATTHGCDSLTTIHLAVMPVWQVDDNQVVCDSLRWIDGQLYMVDTVGPLDTLHTIFGCDSVVQLLLTVNPSKHYVYTDTSCEGQHYYFRGRYLDHSGYHADTLYTTEGCDSVLGVVLTVLPVPPLSIGQSYDCATQSYILQAESEMPYLWWLSDPDDEALYPQRHSDMVSVSPDTTTTYRLYADYSPLPRCPQTASVTLVPFTVPKAKMRVSPGILNANNRTFEARDVGKTYAWREWYIDGVLLEETGYIITAEANEDADTVRVMLVVGDDRCTDTAKANIPMEWHTLYAPNAFTPGAESNREFYVAGRNIASFEISIYNRRGVLVYRSNDINGRWDGRNMQGHDCPSGNYVYYILYSTTFRPFSSKKQVGQVLLIR